MKIYKLSDGSAFSVASIARRGFFSHWIHKLFYCPTFWSREPAFKCPDCGKTYKCYWDGNDVGGKINLCDSCAKINESTN